MHERTSIMDELAALRAYVHILEAELTRALAVEKKRRDVITEINYKLFDKVSDTLNIGECAYCHTIYVEADGDGYYGICEICGVEMCVECATKKAGARVCDCGIWGCGPCIDAGHGCETITYDDSD